MKPIKLTREQQKRINAAITERRTCQICKAKLTVPGGNAPRSARALCIQPFNTVTPIWDVEDTKAGTLGIGVFCFECWKTMNEFVRKLVLEKGAL